MMGEYFTKPLQGAKLIKFRDTFSNVKYGYMIEYKPTTGVCWRKIKIWPPEKLIISR